jgi:hypothetical protein
MTDRPSPPEVEQPRFEPEIIPPDRANRAGMPGGTWSRVFVDEHGTHRVFVGRIGPAGIILGSLLVGIVSAAALIVVLGIFLVWIPVVGLIVGALLISGWLRAYFNRPR